MNRWQFRILQRLFPVFVAFTWCSSVWAAEDIAAVHIEAPQTKAWVGQRVPFFVKLKANGPLVGAAGFSIPQIPRVLIVKVGNPVVSSEEVDDESWLVQTHEFALFSQASGTVEIPSFDVRFTSRDGYIGPEADHIKKLPALQIEIRRPPGQDEAKFLVTTDKIQVTEVWEPEPGSAKQGDVFRRTITQTADQTSGMALAPPPTTAPEGVRVYTGKPEITDNTERGEFKGRRRDTITYVMERPGELSLPSIQYVWWDPESEKFGSHTLPGITFNVTAWPKPATDAQGLRQDRRPAFWASLAAVLCIVLALQYRRIARFVRDLRRRFNPPDRVAARKLMRACRRNDAPEAQAAWFTWQNTQPAPFHVSSRLRAATTELQRCLYGLKNQAVWQGQELRQAFREQLDGQRWTQADAAADLPTLNPGSRVTPIH